VARTSAKKDPGLAAAPIAAAGTVVAEPLGAPSDAVEEAPVVGLKALDEPVVGPRDPT